MLISPKVRDSIIKDKYQEIIWDEGVFTDWNFIMSRLIEDLLDADHPNKGASMIRYKSQLGGGVKRNLTDKLQEIYSVLDYGIDNTGNANIAAKTRELVRNVGLNGGGKIVFKPGDYRFSPDPDGYGIQIQWDNIEIEIEAGAEIYLYDPNYYMRARGFEGCGLFHVGAPIPGIDPSYMLNFPSTWGFQGYNYYEDPLNATDPNLTVPPYVTQDIHKGDRQIQLNTTQGFSPGSWVYLRSNDWFHRPGNPHETLRTQLVRVRSVDSVNNIIHTDIHVIENFRVEGNGLYCLAIPIRLVNNVHFHGRGRIRGMEFTNMNDLPNTGEGEIGIRYDWFINGSVNGLKVEKFPNAQIRHGVGFNFSGDQLNMEGHRLNDQDGNPKNGYYGITSRGTLYSRYSNIHGMNLRNTCDTGTGTTLARQVIYDNVQSVGNHAMGVTTHSVIDTIMNNVQAKDCAGGISFRGINLIANNLQLEGNRIPGTGTGGITIGEYAGGDGGLGDPESDGYNFGNIIMNNVQAFGFDDPIMIDGSVENLIMTNFSGDQLSSERNFMRMFTPAIGNLKLRNFTIDCTNQPDGAWAWGISIWEWSNTVARRGMIDIQGITFVNPSAGGLLINGVHEFTDNMETIGDYIIKNNSMILSGVKAPPLALCRFNSGYFGYVDASDNRVLGAGAMAFTGVPVQIQVPYSNFVKGLPNNSNVYQRKNATGTSFTTPWNFDEEDLNGVTYTMGMSIVPYMPVAGYSYEQLCTRSGTIGTFEATGSISEGSNILTLSNIETGSLRPGQWIAVVGAGSESGFTPLRTMVKEVEGNTITLIDAAVRTVSNESVTYQAPELAVSKLVGLNLQGDDSPHGKIEAPRSALYHQTEPEEDDRVLWLSTDWNDKRSWEPLYSKSSIAFMKRLNAENLLNRMFSDPSQSASVYDRKKLFQLIRSWNGVISQKYSMAIFPVINDDDTLSTILSEMDAVDAATVERASTAYVMDIDSTSGREISIDEPSLKHWKRYIRSDLNQRAAESYGIEFQGSYWNLLDQDISGWSNVNSSLVEDLELPSPFGVGDNFHWFAENTSVGNHTIFRTVSGVPSDPRGTTHFSIFIYCPDISLMENRTIYMTVRGHTNQTQIAHFDLNNPGGFTFDDAGWPSLEYFGDGLYRASIHVVNSGAGSSSYEVSLRTVLNGSFSFAGDTVERFAVCAPMLTDLRDTVRFLLPEGSSGTPTDADGMNMNDFDLETESLVIDVLAKWNYHPYRVFAIGDHEIWSDVYRDNDFATDQGMYYRNAHTDEVVPLIPLEFSNFPLLRNGRMCISIDNGILKISSLGVTRLEMVLDQEMKNDELVIGGEAGQNFIIGQIIRIPGNLSGYDLDKASSLD